MAARIDPRLAEPQVLVAALPDASGEAANPDVHIAKLCPNRRALLLQPAQIGTGQSVDLGSEAVVQLSEAADVFSGDHVIRVMGPGGRLLAQMHVESDEDERAWTNGIRSLLGNAGGRGGGSELPASAGLAARQLHERSNVLGQRIENLEAISHRRDAQMQKMHHRLQGAMQMLKAVQEMCSQQKNVLRAQQDAIAELEREQLEGPQEPAQGSDAGRGEDEAEPEGDEEMAAKAEKMLALLRQADQMQQVLENLMGQAQDGELEPSPVLEAMLRSSPLPMMTAPAGSRAGMAPAAAADDDGDDGEDGDDAETAAALLGKLRSLEAEKEHFEELLRNSMQEQQDMVGRLSDMRGLMETLREASEGGAGST